MRRQSRPILTFIVYWYAAFSLVGLISLLHGDCWVAPGGHAAQAQCLVEKRRLDLVGLAIAAVGYIILVYRSRRENR